jgi:hypothetical protein
MTFGNVLFTHFLADFVYQSREIATTKSSNNISLLKHVGTYTYVFVVQSVLDITLFSALRDNWKTASIDRHIAFIGINVVLHFVTDYFTSRASTKAYKAGDLHRFWCIIGFDQMLHATTLYYSWKGLMA